MLPRHPPKCPSKPPKATKPTPQFWLMADLRLGEDLPAAARKLPPQAAIIIRPHAMTSGQLAPACLRQLRAIARARRSLLLHANQIPPGFDGAHASGGKRHGQTQPLSFPVHQPRDIAAARRSGARYVLISPLYASASHVGAPGIGIGRFHQLAQAAKRAGMVAIALGGMDAARFRTARRHGASGWAAISAWLQTAAINAD